MAAGNSVFPASKADTKALARQTRQVKLCAQIIRVETIKRLPEPAGEVIPQLGDAGSAQPKSFHSSGKWEWVAVIPVLSVKSYGRRKTWFVRILSRCSGTDHEPGATVIGWKSCWHKHMVPGNGWDSPEPRMVRCFRAVARRGWHNAG